MKRYCLAAVITASLGVSYSAQAYNCAGVPVWDSSTVYVGSDKVQKPTPLTKRVTGLRVTIRQPFWSMGRMANSWTV